MSDEANRQIDRIGPRFTVTPASTVRPLYRVPGPDANGRSGPGQPLFALVPGIGHCPVPLQEQGEAMAHVHAPGLVLRMDPDELLRQGAHCSCDEDLAVHAQHFFVCIEADAREGSWVPLFNGPRVGSREIPGAAKSGHPRWQGGASHYLPEQIWRASHKAAQRAAAVAHDQSSPKVPNLVADAHLPKRDEFPAFGPAPA